MKITWLIGSFLTLLTVSASAQPNNSPGLLLDDEAYNQLPYDPVLTKEPLKSKVSLEAFCPPVQAQGAYGTCVGFACGYYLRTILEAKARHLTNKSAIRKLAFSPSYLYEKAKADGDYACTQGVYLTKVFAVLKDVGVVPFRSFPYPACGQRTNDADALAARYRIKGYERLFNVEDGSPLKIYSIKKSLAEGNPVVVGLVTPKSFFRTGTFTRWEPKPGEDPQDKTLRGHALCIIGYDDTRYGGAFRVINSFGPRWADGGYCWISYQNLARFTRYGYKISA